MTLSGFGSGFGQVAFLPLQNAFSVQSSICLHKVFDLKFTKNKYYCVVGRKMAKNGRKTALYLSVANFCYQSLTGESMKKIFLIVFMNLNEKLK